MENYNEQIGSAYGRQLSNVVAPKPTTIITAFDDLQKISAMLADILARGEGIAGAIGGNVGVKVQPESSGHPNDANTTNPITSRLNEIAERIRRQVNEVDAIFQRISASVG